MKQPGAPRDADKNARADDRTDNVEVVRDEVVHMLVRRRTGKNAERKSEHHATIAPASAARLWCTSSKAIATKVTRRTAPITIIGRKGFRAFGSGGWGEQEHQKKNGRRPAKDRGKAWRLT